MNLIYLIIITAVLTLALYQIYKRAKTNYLSKKEYEEKTPAAQETDRLKVESIDQVSHEFKTPLNLILGAIQSLVKQQENKVLIAKNDLEIIQHYTNRLLQIVNGLQLRVKPGEKKLNVTEGDIIALVRELSNSFSRIANERNIDFNVEADEGQIITLFDRDKLESILLSLLSNAFKFTPEGGSITVTVNTHLKDEAGVLKLAVKDTGIGIAPENLEKIFEKFFQADSPSNLTDLSRGVCLSITRELVKLHGGEISVFSEVNMGTCFVVTLPLTRREQQPSPAPLVLSEPRGAAINKNRSHILVVEDNEDFRFYLKDNLSTLYHIQEACNGAEGWQKTVELMPDMIVSDVVMPEMNGIEFCSKVRGDARTSHIPFILLTGQSSEELRLQGLEIGADDYIVKPFNFEILNARIRNLISLRSHVHKKSQRNVQIKGSEIKISSLDEIFIAKAVKIVEENIGDPEFSVEDLSRALGLSRAHLYRKLLALTGKSVIEFIRVIKLQRAAQLLEKSQLTIAEIAYRVGFNSPKYFTKYFKEQYKVIPSVYANRKGGSASPET